MCHTVSTMWLSKYLDQSSDTFKRYYSKNVRICELSKILYNNELIFILFNEIDHIKLFWPFVMNSYYHWEYALSGV